MCCNQSYNRISWCNTTQYYFHYGIGRNKTGAPFAYMNKQSHTQYSVRWNYLSIPKLVWLHCWSLVMDNQFHPTLCNGCNYLSMLGLKIINVSNRGPRDHNWCSQKPAHISPSKASYWVSFADILKKIEIDCVLMRVNCIEYRNHIYWKIFKEWKDMHRPLAPFTNMV